MTEDEARKARNAHEAHSESGEPKEKPLADEIEELRADAEQIEAAAWTNSRVLGKDNVWAFRVNERLTKRITENLAQIEILERQLRKRKEKERE